MLHGIVLRPHRVLLAASLVLVACGLVACDGADTQVAKDAPPGVVVGADSIAPPSDSVPTGWEAEAGELLILPGEEGLLSGAVVRAAATDQTLGDTSGLRSALGDARIDLFTRGGAVGAARVRVELPSRVDAGCTAWPLARLSFDGAPATRPWTVAFLAGRIDAMALDSIESLPPRDSATLAAQMVRLASRLPDDTNPTFRARPYVVQRAWISRRDSQPLAVALLIRRVNQEDAPLEERLVLVLDRSSAERANPWQVGWHERASGTEDELIVAEPLLAYRVRGERDAHLLFGRDDGYALSATVLVRRSQRWQVLWESAIAGCGG